MTLLCGHTLCIQHLDGLEIKFKCFFCNKQHSIPEEGFIVNKSIEKMIESFQQSDPLRIKIKESFDKLNRSVKDYASIDPDLYYCNYFAKIRNKVDLQQDELIN